MRLLQVDADNFSLVEYLGSNVPSYAILSHTWGKDKEEVSYHDLADGSFRKRTAFPKLQFCRKQAAKDGFKYYWVDTCCIDKSNSTELHEAITCMFRWYQKAEKCYVLLSDVSSNNVDSHKSSLSQATELAFRNSRWFTRGWTLQELIAPSRVEFFSAGGDYLGDRVSLLHHIHRATGIPVRALQGDPMHLFPIEERLSWAEKRITKREEDKAYSLLGIFNVYIPLIYGEGQKNAFRRLREEITKAARDPPTQRALGKEPSGRACSFLDTAHFFRVPWVVPLSRPRTFIGRESQLTRLGDHVSAKNRRLAIYGLGGCGKTALALEFVYRIKQRYPECAIFWVSAVTREGFERSYHDIGLSLDLPNVTSEKTDIKQIVKSKLSQGYLRPWLMVIDNADDFDLLFGSPQYGQDRLIDYLPDSGNGSVIITTRTRKAAVQLAEHNLLALGALDRAEAGQLLRTCLISELHDQLEDSATVDAFLHMLAVLALAIVQAIAFINTNDSTISQYMRLYKANWTEATMILSRKFEDQSRYSETDNTVATTWFISFDHIRKSDSAAADYLSFMACVASSSIPAEMLPAKSSAVEQSEALGTLKAYAFITERQSPEFGSSVPRVPTHEPVMLFDVHPLVHLAIRGWLDRKKQSKAWLETTIERLIELIPYGDYRTRDIWTPYLPHATFAAQQAESQDIQARASLLERIGYCQHTLGRYRVAEDAHRETLSLRRTVLGEEHSDTLTSMSEVARALSDQGRYSEAEELHHKTLRLRLKTLGERHQHTLTSMDNVAQVLSDQGRSIEAEEMHREILRLRNDLSEQERWRTLTNMSDRARALSKQGKYVEAEEMHRKTLSMRVKVSGEEHPHTLMTTNNVAQALSNQGNYVEAEELHRKTLRLRKRILGEEHPQTLTSTNNLAQALSNQGKYAEAERLHRKTLRLRMKVSGEEHPHTLTSMNNVAQVLSDQGKYDEAEEMHRKTLQLRLECSGEKHPYTLTSMSNVARALSKQGKYAEAEKIHRKVLRLRRNVLGQDHPDTLTSMNNVAQGLSSQGKYLEAEKMHRKVFEARKRVSGEKYPHTLISMSNVAQTCSDQGRFAEAEEMHRSTLRLRVEKLGKDHPHTLTSMDNVAQALRDQKKYLDAEEMHRQTLMLRLKVLGKRHPDTLASMSNIAQILGDREAYLDALPFCEQAYSGFSEILRLDHPTSQACFTQLTAIARLLALEPVAQSTYV